MREIVAFGHYYKDFIDSLQREDQLKVKRILTLLSTEDRIPRHFIESMGSGLYQLRISLPKRESRLFFIYDGNTLVVIFNCFIKKQQKTPRQEIEKARRLIKEYYANK